MPRQAPLHSHRAVFDANGAAGSGLYLGHDETGWRHAAPQQSVMVLGPPRSGKTTSLIIPNVLAASGAVVSTSTKPDVLHATAAARAAVGRCLLFDPTGTAPRDPRLQPMRWSPLQSCTTWTGAQATAAALVEVGSAPSGGRVTSDGSHWLERARALLAPLLHAAALEGHDLRTLLTWVDRRQALPAQQILSAVPGSTTALARNLLDGIASTDPRELSGIWSTTSGALGGLRSEAALAAAAEPDFDPARFVRSTDTVYLAAPAHLQSLVAPLVVGLLNDIRFATYERHAAAPDTRPRPVLLALDEVANIAPVPDLPSMLSEGGGQGLLTLACFQDLSQARQRWPGAADGFPSLFGTTVVLPGIGDVRTLEALSQLAGEEEVVVTGRSTGRSPTDRPLTDLVSGGRPHVGETLAGHVRRRLPVDVLAHGSPGHALAFDERNRPAWIPLAPSHVCEPWRTLRGMQLGTGLERRTPERSRAVTGDLHR